MTEKEFIMKELNFIKDTIDLPDDELKKRHAWLNDFDEVNYAMRCGIIKAEIDYIFEKLEGKK